MAMSAFKSTTRRSQIGPAECSGPATPSRSDASTRKGSHRRSRSMSDFSQKYFSDDSSTSEYQGYSQRVGRRERSSTRQMPSDSESDMESGYSRQRYQHRNVEFGDGRDCAPPSVAINTYPQHRVFRKTSSHQDLVIESHSKCGASITCDDSRGQHPENPTEEKTIKAVYAQMKCLRTDPASKGSNTTNLYDAMRAEVRHAVAEIRMELEQSMKRNCSASGHSEGGTNLESKGTDVIQAVADIRKEYAAKLEQSEKRVRELWSQLAVEERRCLELAKIVQELLPASSSSSNLRVSHRRRGSAEKQLVSKSLHEEAQKYFEECVSISGLEYSGDFDNSSQENDQHYKDVNGKCDVMDLASGKEINAKALVDMKHETNKNTQCKVQQVGSDGVILPWLQWEADSGVNEKNLEKEGKTHDSPSSSSISNIFHYRRSKEEGKNHNSPASSSSSNIFHNRRSKGSSASKSLSDILHSSTSELLSPERSSGQVSTNQGSVVSTLISNRSSNRRGSSKVDGRGACTRRDDQLSRSSSAFADKRVNNNLIFPDVDNGMLERINFRHRIDYGELILCQTPFL